MSPLALRRYRAERLLRRDFRALRPAVLARARGRLGSQGIHVDDADLDACYAQAWQGLYAATLAGEPVTNPSGWLATVTVRRAIDEHRQALIHAVPADTLGDARQVDPLQRLDDLTRLREVFEALTGRLSQRECEAACLCYLQGMSRSEAARRMGVSVQRMDKLMDGAGGGAPGVAAKVGELLSSIRGGRWCEEQASLMRGLAFGLLDPDGDRYRLAVVHHRECPGCRAYVASLRGLAAVLPPVSLPWPVAAAGGGAAAAGGASGGWLVAGGSVTAKVAATCLLAVGLGAGCVALTRLAPARPSPRVAVARVHPRDRPRHRPPIDLTASVAPPLASELAPRAAAATLAIRHATVRATRTVAVRPAARAAREFGFQAASAASAAPAPAAPEASAATATSSRPSTATTPPASTRQAEHEFGVQ